ncbi:transposase [Streptomyces mirabilis]|uniref:transposase n=1 Tax=Streptomyces mirabilis TaxID=68239 RepID=UPI003425F278
MQVARASNPGGTTAMWVRDRPNGLWRDEDFADWYPRDGRPCLSPAQLATVCVLQFLFDLSDRQVAEAVRCRIDFKYALSMVLDDPGCGGVGALRGAFAHQPSLLETGQREIKEAVGAAVLSEPVAEVGQHAVVDHVLAAVRDLTRLELVTETVRAALEEVAGPAAHLLAMCDIIGSTGLPTTA